MQDNNNVHSSEYPDTIAAVDLGSNSFHMVVARVDEHGNFSLIDRLKEMVRLRGGLDAQNNLSEEKKQEALACLQRFGDRIRHLDAKSVRAAGTNTLRTMNDSRVFLEQANEALGHRIEIIPGHEEARLIYLGVSHTHSDDINEELVVDIGGGSTEFIIGKGFTPVKLESLNFGSVSVSQRFFPGGDLSETYWQSANTALRLEIMPIRNAFKRGNWYQAIGSSGTIKATLKIIQQLGLDEFEISLKSLYAIRDKVLDFEHINDVNLPGLSEARAPVYAGGLAVLTAVFESLNIKRMSVSDGALREGLLYDLLGRIQHEDVRDRTVHDLMERFNIDTEHARRVRKTAMHLFEQLRLDWNMSKKSSSSLIWAANLHELGLSITHDKHHLQGAHILKYADLPGFAQRGQRLLSLLVKTHRKKFDNDVFDSLARQDRRIARKLVVILRLSVLLHRSRNDELDMLPEIKVSDKLLQLDCEQISGQQDLLYEDLQREAEILSNYDYQLVF